MIKTQFSAWVRLKWLRCHQFNYQNRIHLHMDPIKMVHIQCMIWRSLLTFEHHLITFWLLLQLMSFTCYIPTKKGRRLMGMSWTWRILKELRIAYIYVSWMPLIHTQQWINSSFPWKCQKLYSMAVMRLNVRCVHGIPFGCIFLSHPGNSHFWKLNLEISAVARAHTCYNFLFDWTT